jgi:hypothetical protein
MGSSLACIALLCAGFTHGELIPSDDVIPVQSLSTGSYAANAFGGFTTPATTVSNSGGTHYIAPTSPTNAMLAYSNRSYRDFEITASMANGHLYIGMAGGTTFVLTNNSAANGGNGDIRLGAFTNFVPAPADGGGTTTNAFFYVNSNPAGTISGYGPSATLTLGHEGFDVYFKCNGVEIYRYTEWRICQFGVAAVWTQSGFGSTDITVHYLPQKYLYGDPDASIYDTRDFGMRRMPAVTGSMTASGNQVTLSANAGFQVGDPIIVEIGGETGGGLRNSVGVGGQWPALGFPTLAAMNADTGEPNNTSAYLETTGDVYTFRGGVWVSSFPWQTYYPAKIVPLSLTAKVTTVSGDGLTLTLDQTAVVDTTSANIWLDCSPSFYVLNQNPGNAIPPSPTAGELRIPAGNWMLGSSIANKYPISTSWNIHGQGRASTTLTSAKGVESAAINLSEIQVDNVILSDMAYVGNFGDNGFMFHTVNGQFASYPSAFMLADPSVTHTGIIARNMDGINTFGRFIGLSSAAPLIDNCTVTLTSGQRDYVGWQFQIFDCANGIIRDCTATSSWTVRTFEFFACNGGSFINCGGQNTVFATNSSSNTTIDLTQNVIFTPLCFFKTQATGIDESIFNINANAFHHGNTGTMICRPGFKCVQQGYVDASNNTFKFIQIDSTQTNWTIQGGFLGGAGCNDEMGGYFEAPNYYAGSPEFGPIIYSDAANTIVTGIRVKGTAIGPPGHSKHYTNISLAGANSSVTNCVADAVQSGPTQSGNQTNATFCPYRRSR